MKKRTIAALCMSAVLALCGTAMAGCKGAKESGKKEAEIIFYCRGQSDSEYRLTREQPIMEATFVKSRLSERADFRVKVNLGLSPYYGKAYDYRQYDMEDWIGFRMTYLDEEAGETRVSYVEKEGTYRLVAQVDAHNRFVEEMLVSLTLHVVHEEARE